MANTNKHHQPRMGGIYHTPDEIAPVAPAPVASDFSDGLLQQSVATVVRSAASTLAAALEKEIAQRLCVDDAPSVTFIAALASALPTVLSDQGIQQLGARLMAPSDLTLEARVHLAKLMPAAQPMPADYVLPERLKTKEELIAEYREFWCITPDKLARTKDLISRAVEQRREDLNG